MNSSEHRQTLALRSAAAHRRGSILLLVAAVLVLIFLIGLALLDVTRRDQVATTQIRKVRDMDEVSRAVIGQIREVLRRSLGINDNGTPNNFTDDRFFTGSAKYYDYAGASSPWLASTEPNASGVFDQISNIVDNTQILGSTADADASGDGINDAKWKPAIIPSLQNLNYWMAVRIIDNSAMINMNVATSLLKADGTYSAAADAPRAWYPTDIDLGTFFLSFAGVDVTELNNTLSYRLGKTINVSAAPVTFADRGLFWLNGASMYNNYPANYPAASPNNYKKYDMGVEMALRYRNGLKNPTTETELEFNGNGMLKFTRNLNLSGTTPNNYTLTTKPIETKYADAMKNINAVNSTSYGSTIADYYAYEPRHQMTTISGHACWGMPMTADTNLVRQRDINKLLANDAKRIELATEIAKVLNEGGTFALPTGFASVNDYASQLAAAINDYADSDNALTSVNGRFGMEALPFVTEVYAQRYYMVTASTENPVGSGNWDVTWTQQATAGYAVEIKNPFRKPADVRNVQLWVNGVNVGALTALGAPASMAPDETIVLYVNSGDAGGSQDVSALVAGTATKTVIATPFAWPAVDGNITVELRAPAQAGGNCTWGYSKTTNAGGMPDTYDENGVASAGDPKNTLTGYKQITSIGNSEKLNVITVASGGFVQRSHGASIAAYDTTLENLGDSPKPNGAAGAIAAGSLINNQLLFSDTGSIVHIGDLAMIAVLPLDGTKSVGDAWGAATTAGAHMLNISPSAALANATATNDRALPHSQLLLDRFTTLSPYEDGFDNDGDGVIDNPEEQLIVGTVNLNTASKAFLNKVLPIPDATIRSTIVDNIVAYRDGARPAGFRSAKGIASIGELLNIITPLESDAADNYQTTAGTPIDFDSNPSTTAPSADGIVDDREETTLFARWLMQVCSTRSDVYTAYINIRATTGNSATANIVGERHIVVVFDRSNLTYATGTVRILGMLQY
ncbi:MAG: hypothetical protein GC162_19775 [Planctomycetes bacterium]|nr:hypothetical protein [Planctomycetota bacterium]